MQGGEDKQLVKQSLPFDHEQAVKAVLPTRNVPLSSLLFGKRRALAQHPLDVTVRLILFPAENSKGRI